MDIQNTIIIFILILILIISCFICIYNDFDVNKILADARNLTCICLILLIISSIIASVVFISKKQTDPDTAIFANPFTPYLNQQGYTRGSTRGSTQGSTQEMSAIQPQNNVPTQPVNNMHNYLPKMFNHQVK